MTDGCSAPRVGAPLHAVLVVARQLVFVGLARRRDLGDPGLAAAARQGVGERFEERELVADDAELERPVASQITAFGMDTDGLDVGVDPIFVRARHRVLADEDDQVGAHVRARREARGQPMIVWEMAAHRAAGHHRDVVLLHRG